MPSRKRHRSASAPAPSATSASSTPAAERTPERTAGRTADDEVIAQFAAALRESEARERAEQERRRAQRSAAEQLEVARAELDRAIAEVRRARRTRSGLAEADATWRAAKAKVIELETGAPPDWAPTVGDRFDGSDRPDGAQHAEADVDHDTASSDTDDRSGD